MSICAFERQPAWHKSVDLIRVIHRFTHHLPTDEKSLLTA